MRALTWEDLREGVAAEFEVVVTEEMMARFCATTGDDNALHLDRAFAAHRGFDDRVVYGLLTASFYSTLVGVHLPGGSCLLHGLKIDFTAPVYVGDRLCVRGRVAHRNEAYRQLEIACEIENQRARVVSKGRLRVGLLGPRSSEETVAAERGIGSAA